MVSPEWGNLRRPAAKAERPLFSNEATFAGASSSDADAPIPAVRAATIEQLGSTLMSRSRPHQRVSDSGRSHGTSATVTADSRQFVEERLRLFQIGGVEPLGEPAIDRRQQLARLRPPPLLPP